MGDEDRQIAHDRHAVAVGIGFQGRQLGVETPLHERPETDLIGQTQARRAKRAGLAFAYLGRPMPPGLAAVFGFKRHEQRVIIQPGGFAFLPIFEGGAFLCSVLQPETGKGRAQLA